MALAAFGLADNAGAAPVRPQGYCQIHSTFGHGGYYTGMCVNPGSCLGVPSADCPTGPAGGKNAKPYFGCGGLITPLDLSKGCSFAI
jgi:hypothetical protein